jgi:hypothetical protein
MILHTGIRVFSLVAADNIILHVIDKPNNSKTGRIRSYKAEKTEN